MQLTQNQYVCNFSSASSFRREAGHPSGEASLWNAAFASLQWGKGFWAMEMLLGDRLSSGQPSLRQTAGGRRTKQAKTAHHKLGALRGKFWSVDTILISWRDLFCPRSNSFWATPGVDTQLIKKSSKAVHNQICFQNGSPICQRQLTLYCPFFLLLKKIIGWFNQKVWY